MTASESGMAFPRSSLNSPLSTSKMSFLMDSQRVTYLPSPTSRMDRVSVSTIPAPTAPSTVMTSSVTGSRTRLSASTRPLSSHSFKVSGR